MIVVGAWVVKGIILERTFEQGLKTVMERTERAGVWKALL